VARPFEFALSVKTQARIRQAGMCAVCGSSLDDFVEHAHHVIPNQSGSSNDPSHAPLRSVDNCVVLCDLCHERVHENGRYRLGAVAPPSYYRFSHGRKFAAHGEWLAQLEKLGQKIWK
jgi:hypothetical protein